MNKSYKKNINSEGQAIVEWWVVVTLIAVCVIAIFIIWGQETNKMMNKLNNTLNSVNDTGN